MDSQDVQMAFEKLVSVKKYGAGYFDTNLWDSASIFGVSWAYDSHGGF